MRNDNTEKIGCIKYLIVRLIDGKIIYSWNIKYEEQSINFGSTSKTMQILFTIGTYVNFRNYV